MMRHLRREGSTAGRRPIRRLMRLMGMQAVYRRSGLTMHVAKVPEGSQTQSESTLTLPSNRPTQRDRPTFRHPDRWVEDARQRVACHHSGAPDPLRRTNRDIGPR